MADPEEDPDVFDAGLKKKKKKKVVLADDGEEAGEGGEGGVEAATEEVGDLSVDDFGSKKKKKSKKPKEGEDGEEAAGADGEGGEGGEGDGEFGKKKKKKKSKKEGEEDGGDDDNDGGGGGDGDDGEGADGEGGEGGLGDYVSRVRPTGSGLPWDGTSRDYHYDELLGRVFGILREKNPALSEKTKTIIKPPQVLREGTKKTVFVNLVEICNAMHRLPEHVIQYLMAELGTSGTLDGQSRLILKGRFLPKVFEGVLRHYFIDYVICQMCKSSDTLLVKEAGTRLSYCRCQACGASRSVTAIQKGFQAVSRGDRRKQRNAT